MQTIRDILRTSLGRSLESLSPLDRLVAAWPVACGKAMAARGRLTAYTGSEVHILIDDPRWFDQMLSMRSVLARDLARIAAVPVTAIHLQVSRPGRPAISPEKTPE